MGFCQVVSVFVVQGSQKTPHQKTPKIKTHPSTLCTPQQEAEGGPRLGHPQRSISDEEGPQGKLPPRVGRPRESEVWSTGKVLVGEQVTDGPGWMVSPVARSGSSLICRQARG